MKPVPAIAQSRLDNLQEWLTTACHLTIQSLVALPYDASFRRYYRLTTDTKNFVVMDAPNTENLSAFIHIAHALRHTEVHAPEIFYADLAQGFLLLTDFGDATYLKTLTEKNADTLYQTALLSLSRMQTLRNVSDYTLPIFSRDWFLKEWDWHQEWFIDKWLDLSFDVDALQQCYQLLIHTILSQPQTFMHRDFHSANLMVLNDHEVGVLDFQDAFLGPITYDAASLLRDCYITWPETRVQQWLYFYFNLLKKHVEFSSITFTDFTRWFDFTSIQRHLKALMTFARKAVRDADNRYLQHIPRTISYIEQIAAKYAELKPLHEYAQLIDATVRRKLSCAQ